MKAQIVWAESTDIEDVLGGEVYATVYASRMHPQLVEAVESVNEALEWEAQPQAYLLLPVTFEDGEPVVHGPWDTLHNVEDADEGVNMCLEWCGDLLTLARQAREE